MRGRRFGLLAVLFFAGLIALLVLSGLNLLRCRNAAYAAAQNLESCRELAEKIEALKVAPDQASLERRTLQDLARKIEEAAQVAEIPHSAIVSISPQAGRRIGSSPLLAHPTSVQIRDTPIKQLVRFLIELSAEESGLEATSLRLVAPRNAPPAQAEERWTAELVLTYLLYSPQSAPAQSGDSGKPRAK